MRARRRAKVKVKRRHRDGSSRAARRSRSRNANKPPKHMVISAGDSKYTVEYSPKETTRGSIARKWEEVEKGGKAYMFDRGASIPTLSFSIIVASTDHRSVEGDLKRLMALAGTTKDVKIKYSKLENGVWHITSMDIRSVQRHDKSQAVIWAEVDLQLTSATAVKRNASPVDKAGKSKKKPKIASAAYKSTKNVKHKVKKGDSLTKISQQYRGSSDYADIARLNNIKDPSVLPYGRTFNVPVQETRRSSGRGD